MEKEFKLGRKRIGLANPAYFIADIAANHDCDLERARLLIHLCAEAGADAAKFQNFRAGTIVSDYGFRTLGSQISHQANWNRSVYEAYEAASLPLAWTETLKQTCDEAGIDYLTAPYDLNLIDELNSFVCAWKVGSGDITWHENIEATARTGKPVLIATGAANMDEVEAAVAVAERHTDEIVVMQCNTNYTASLENFRYIALNVLKTYAEKWPHHVLGLSDHTPGHATVLGSVALGAKVIEKHFTDDTNREGPDHVFSMDPQSWREMVERTRELELALGPSDKHVMENESETVLLQRRAVRSAHDIAKGHRITEDDLICVRPCPKDGLPPNRIADVIGRTTHCDIPAGDLVRLKDCE